MWVDVVAIYVTCILSTASFITAACLLESCSSSLVLNISYGIFGSGFLSLCTAIISYWHERTDTLEHFLQEARKIQRQFNSYPTGGTVPEKMASINRIGQHDATLFYDYYHKIQFLFCHKKKPRQIQLRIVFPIDLALCYIHTASNTYNWYASSGKQPSVKTQEELIYDVNRIIVGNCNKAHTNNGNNRLFGAATYNRFTSNLHHELETYYYDSILYSYKRKRGTR